MTEYVLMRAVVALGSILTVKQATRLTRFSAEIILFCMPRRKKIAMENLSIAFPGMSFPEREALARESFRNLCTSLMDFFRIPKMLAEIFERFEIEGSEHMDEALGKGKGVIFIVSHLGSWEYLGFIATLKGYPLSVIVRDTRNPYIHKWIERLRQKMKLRAIDRLHAIKRVLRELKENRIVSVLIDQWASSEGMWTEFFGRSTSTTSLPARLAAHTGAVMIPGYCIRTAPGKYKIMIRPQIPLAEGTGWEEKMTRGLNEQLENMIRQYPEQWTWSHRRWKPYEVYMKKKESKIPAG